MLFRSCDGEKVDGKCGCKRAFSGIDSAKATTTAIVAELEDSARQVFTEKLSNHWINNWRFTKEQADKRAKDGVKEVERIANTFFVGQIVEKRGNKIQTRMRKLNS